MTKLRVQEVQKHFGKNGLNETTFSLDSGDYLCVVGESGSGKTTMLNIAAGMLRPESGSVFIDEKDIYLGMKEKQRTALRRSVIAYMMQGSTLIPELTVRQNIVCPTELSGKKADKDKLSEIVSRLRIENIMDSYPAEISGGEYRRAMLARVLMPDSEILMLDEPTSNLDEKSADIVRTVLSEIHMSGKSLIVVTHDKAFFKYSTKALEIK
jgi:putative ABC transport system ATP-binding protein